MKRIGNYRIERQLAITGTSVHYEAVHLVMPRRAIIKVTLAMLLYGPRHSGLSSNLAVRVKNQPLGLRSTVNSASL